MILLNFVSCTAVGVNVFFRQWTTVPDDLSAWGGQAQGSNGEIFMKAQWLRYMLGVGVVYFCLMATAHFMGLKYPLLFVYYDTPFYAYQDKIISFSVLAYASLFYAAIRHIQVVPMALFALGVTVLGLSLVNISSDLQSVLQGQGTLIYWLQTGFFAVYFLVLLALYKGASRSE